jgi:D-serine dehydratase
LQRFAGYLKKAFPQTQDGLIESDLVEVPYMKRALEAQLLGQAGRENQTGQEDQSGQAGQTGRADQSGRAGKMVEGTVYLKLDSHLPISGSVKARGGIYEVLKIAEEVAINNDFLIPGNDYADFDSEKYRNLLSRYSIAVGSTGNLGLSIGIMSAKLGFKVFVHMSSEAKEWKKKLLRSKGATVIEHAGDYALAVETGRSQSKNDPQCYFIDDENSLTLFLGYAVAALRLQSQLRTKDIAVDKQHPLFVYLPCGVGGAPGGITFGLRTIFGDNVHCFFAEPTQAPSMLIGLMTGKHNEVSVKDFGIDPITEADGLAVGRPSGFVGKILEKDISGVFTVTDDRLFKLLKLLADTENIFLEPSAMAGFPGPWRLVNPPAGRKYIKRWGLEKSLPGSSHIIWATAGSMVPQEVMEDYYAGGQKAEEVNGPDLLGI